MRGKGRKLGEPCPKVRLSQDRLPIEPFAHIFLSLSIYIYLSIYLSGLLRTNVVRATVASRKCHSTENIVGWQHIIFYESYTIFILLGVKWMRTKQRCCHLAISGSAEIKFTA